MLNGTDQAAKPYDIYARVSRVARKDSKKKNEPSTGGQIAICRLRLAELDLPEGKVLIDPGAQGRCGPFARGRVSFLHTRWRRRPARRRGGHPAGSSSRHRTACPFDTSPGAPPASHPRHRCTGTRGCAAISATGTRSRTFPPPPAGPAPAADGPQRLNRRPAHISYTVHIATYYGCQPLRHRQLKVVS
jgi:hypothetical protein